MSYVTIQNNSSYPATCYYTNTSGTRTSFTINAGVTSGRGMMDGTTFDLYSNGSVTFDGFTDGTGFGVRVRTVVIKDRAVTYYYSCDYVRNGGSGGAADWSDSSTSTSYSFTVGSAPSRSGYTFDGWRSNLNGALYQPGNRITLYYGNPDIKLTAEWTAIPVTYNYSVTFNNNGGSGGPSNWSTSSTLTSYRYDIPQTEPTRNDHKFDYWTGSNGTNYLPGTSATLSSSSPALTLTAHWTRTKWYFGVNYDANGGSGEPGSWTGSASSSTYRYTVSRTEPTRSGYKFDYWTRSDGGTCLPGTEITISGTVTLTAHWTALPTYTYSVTYDVNGGTGAPSNWSYGPTTSTTARYDIPQQDPTKSGYTFDYWEGSNGSNYRPGDSVTLNTTTKSVTLKAHWTQSTWPFIVSFNPNGGTGQPADEVFDYTDVKSRYDVPQKEPVLDGYKFDYWVMSNATTGNARGGTSVTLNTGTTVFTAHWTELPKYTYKVTYDLDGGKDGPENFEKESWLEEWRYDVPQITPTKTYCVFQYWIGSDGSNYRGGQTITLKKDTRQELTLTAKWTNEYKVIFAFNGGHDGPEDVTHLDDNNEWRYTVTRTEPVRDGYKFDCWIGDDGSRYKPDQIITLRAGKDPTLRLTAKWLKYCTVTTLVNPLNSGKVTGGGTYLEGTKCVLEATPHDQYSFYEWDDGDQRELKEFIVTSDVTITAHFYPGRVYTIKTIAKGSGEVYGAGKYLPGATVTLSAMPFPGAYFSKWGDNVKTQERTFTATRNATFTAYFVSSGGGGGGGIQNTYFISTYPLPDSHAGWTSGDGQYIEGSQCTISAYPSELHRFAYWDTHGGNPDTFFVYDNENIGAVFERDPQIYVGNMQVTDVYLGSSLLAEVALGGTPVYLD